MAGIVPGPKDPEKRNNARLQSAGEMCLSLGWRVRTGCYLLGWRQREGCLACGPLVFILGVTIMLN
jgi:hypothetical protein